MPADASYYDDGPGSSQAAESGPAPEGGAGDGGGGQTAILPKSILAGKQFNPGDEVVLRVVKVGADEVEVEYASADEPEKTKSPEEQPAEYSDESGGGMSSMME